MYQYDFDRKEEKFQPQMTKTNKQKMYFFSNYKSNKEYTRAPKCQQELRFFSVSPLGYLQAILSKASSTVNMEASGKQGDLQRPLFKKKFLPTLLLHPKLAVNNQ